MTPSLGQIPSWESWPCKDGRGILRIAWCPQGDSNARTRLRRPVLYRLSDGGQGQRRQPQVAADNRSVAHAAPIFKEPPRPPSSSVSSASLPRTLLCEPLRSLRLCGESASVPPSVLSVLSVTSVVKLCLSLRRRLLRHHHLRPAAAPHHQQQARAD